MSTQKATISGELISKDLSIRQLKKVSSEHLAEFIFSDDRVSRVLCNKIKNGSYEEVLGIVSAAVKYSPERIINNFPKLVQAYNQKIKDCKTTISRATTENNAWGNFGYYRGELINYILLDEENKKDEIDRFVKNKSSAYAENDSIYLTNCNIKELEYYIGVKKTNCFLSRFFKRVKRRHWVYNSNVEGAVLFNAMAPSLSKKQFLKHQDVIEKEFPREAIGTCYTSEEMDLKILRGISEILREKAVYDIILPLVINITSDTVRNLHPKTRNRIFGFLGGSGDSWWPVESHVWIRDIENNKEELGNLFFSLMIRDNGAFERLIKNMTSKENKAFWKNNMRT